MSRASALAALAGEPTTPAPVALFTWGFEYTWRVADLAPWQLACGGSDTWHRAYLALVARHQPDLIFYDGAGSGPADPVLLDETREHWIIRDGNTGAEHELGKESLTLAARGTGRRSCDPLGAIASPADADRLIPLATSPGDLYLEGLSRLITDLGDRCLVLPHHSPGYVQACYAFGFEAAMMAMTFEPDLFTHVCDRCAAGEEQYMAALAGAGAEAVFIADGWASADIISPHMFERFALPYQHRIIAAAHAAGLRVIFWNEGDILPILRHEAALACDAFAFEQPRKGNAVTVAAIREAFGPERCLFGNLDSEELLLRGSRQAIEQAVRDQFAQSGPTAPFILCTGSPLPSNADPRVVDVIFHTARS